MSHERNDIGSFNEDLTSEEFGMIPADTLGLAHQLFEKQSLVTPNHDAVVFAGKRLKYSELNRASNQLAQYLMTLGVGPETLVGLCIDRSVDMLVAILGIWKAGGGYVPVDITYPRDRIQYIFQDSACRLIVTNTAIHSQENISIIPANCVPILLDCEKTRTIIQSLPDRNPELFCTAISSRNTAYIIYTSGSTGKPKGVAIEHGSLVNLFKSLARVLPIGSFPKPYQALQNASIAFDSSVKQMTHIMRGGTLHILPEEQRRDANLFYEYLVDNKIECFDITPSLAKVLTPLLKTRTNHDTFLSILVGGEAIDSNLWEDLSSIPNSQCLNVYGPTECTVDTTFASVGSIKTPNIGKALSNVTCYVLDHEGNPVSAGQTGELYIGGAGVARGYLKRPALTAERFLPDPFSSFSGARMYRSGDLVRHLPDSNLEFIGRADDQVKIRGYRVELKEIEIQLMKSNLIKDAAVVTRGSTEKRQLIGYAVPKEKEEIDPKQLVRSLKNWLSDRLPEYMLPDIIIPIEKLPLTPNGKLDKISLAKTNPIGGASFEPQQPISGTERMLFEIWSDLLSSNDFGVDDSFFELGGHSLLAMQMTARIGEKIGINLPVRAVFEHPTIKSLGGHIKSSIHSEQQILRYIPSEDTPNHISWEEEMLFLFGSSVRPPLQIGFKIQGPVNIRAISASLRSIAERHEVFRTRFVRNSGCFNRTVDKSADVNLDLYDLRSSRNQVSEIDSICWNKSNSLDNEGPLFHAFLVQTGERSYIFRLYIAHVVFDMWSAEIFLEELSGFYGLHAHRIEFTRASLPLKYSDYAWSQKQNFNRETLESKIDYWRSRLADLPQPLNLPTDHERLERGTFLMRTVPLTFSKKLSDEIREFCLSEGITLFMFFLATLNILINFYSGEDDVVVICPVTNRLRTDLEGVMGTFVNLLIARNLVNPNSSFLMQVVNTRNLMIEDFEHQDAPFVLIKDMLSELNGQFPVQLFQVILDMNSGEHNVTLDGVDVSDIVCEQLIAQEENPGRSFDLVFLPRETREGIRGRVMYDAKIFNESTAKRISSDFVRFSSLLVHHRHKPIKDVIKEENGKQLTKLDG